MTQTDPLDAHNEQSICKAAADFVESARRAVTEAPHGSLTLKFEWRAYGAHRMVVTKEISEILAPAAT